MVEGAQELRTVQVVQANGAIEARGDKEAHIIVDEDRGDLSIVVV